MWSYMRGKVRVGLQPKSPRLGGTIMARILTPIILNDIVYAYISNMISHWTYAIVDPSKHSDVEPESTTEPKNDF